MLCANGEEHQQDLMKLGGWGWQVADQASEQVSDMMRLSGNNLSHAHTMPSSEQAIATQEEYLKVSWEISEVVGWMCSSSSQKNQQNGGHYNKPEGSIVALCEALVFYTAGSELLEHAVRSL